MAFVTVLRLPIMHFSALVCCLTRYFDVGIDSR